MRDEKIIGTIARTLVSKGVRGIIARIEYQFLQNNNRNNAHDSDVKYTSSPFIDYRPGGVIVFGVLVGSANYRHER
jgi:hypothetical protein